MSETIGTAYIQIEPSTKGISGSIEGALNQEAGKAGKNAGNALSSALGGAIKASTAITAAGTAITAGLVKSATDSFGEYEQLIGGVETLYGASYSSIEEYAEKTGSSLEFAGDVWEEYQNRQQAVLDNAENAYSTAGMSANEYMETVTGFAASLNASLGEYQWQSANYAQMIVTDMADNANKMGTSIESIKNAYAGFAKQNYTMLDNLKLGYGGTKAEMERLLADAEKLAGYDEGAFSVESFADIAEAIHIVQEELGITGTTAKEASITIQGSAASVSAAWQNMLVAISSGEGMDQTMAGFVSSVQGYIGNIIPVIQQSLVGIGDLVKGLAPIITEQLPGLIENVLPGLLDAATTLIGTLLETLVSVLPELLPQIIQVAVSLIEMLAQNLPMIISSLVDALMTAVPILLSALPEILIQVTEAIIQSLPVLIAGIIQLVTMLVEQLPTIIISLIEALPTIIQQVCDALIESLPLLIEAAIELVIALVAALPDIIIALIKAIPKIIVSIVEAIIKCGPKFLEAAVKLLELFKKGFEKIKDIGKNIIEGLWNGIKNAKDWLVGKIKSFCSSALGAIKDFFGIHSPSKVLADEVGKFLPAGIAVGIDANADSAIKAMDDLGNRMNTTLSGRLETVGTDAKYGMQIETTSSRDNQLFDMLAEYLPQIAQGNSITLEGDMKKMFRAVKKQNDIYRKSNGRSAFA